MIAIPNHTALRHLKEVANQRQVWKTHHAGRTCVTRVLTRAQIGAGLAASIQRIVLHGQGSAVGLEENVQLTIEGYRVANRLSRTPWSPPPSPGGQRAADLPGDAAPMWPEVLDAGLTPDGYVYVTTAWVEGTPLHELRPIPASLRAPLAQGVGRILARLHSANVAYGDLKSENLVVGSDGGVSLIDLDTMREVPAALLAVPTRDLSPSWAAPEQTREHNTYLSSDLWAFGVLLRGLFPDGLPAAWQELADACALQDPLERPNTRSVLARLYDDASPLLNWREEPVNLRAARGTAGTTAEATERVPEAPAADTQRVPEEAAADGRARAGTGSATDRSDDGAYAPEPTGATPRRPAGRGCLIAALAALGLSVASCAGAFFWWDARQVAAANDGADEAFSALKAYKTRPEVNRDTSQRAVIRAQADAAWDIRHTPHATAVRALALVWEQGWQDANRRWDEAKYDAAITALDGAAATDVATWMARATVEGGACRLNHADATSAGHCDRALDAVERLRTLLDTAPDPGWLRVELAWTEVLVRGELAEQAVASRSAEAPDRLKAVLATCDDAAQYLGYGPVNAIELQQDCLDYAGLAGDWPRYLQGADALFTGSGVNRTTITHVYRAAGGDCAEVSVTQRRGDWSAKGAPWCTAVGLAARGCVQEAQAVIDRSAALAPDQAWGALEAALSGRPEACRK